MADHEKIYGICENKCQHEVYRKDDADATFLKKTDASSSYAVKSHATNKTTYGIGTSSLYGHVQINTSLNIPEQATSGIALAASAGKALNDKITQLLTRINNLTAQLDELELRVKALEDAK